MLFTLLNDSPIPKALSYHPAYSHPGAPNFPRVCGGGERAVKAERGGQLLFAGGFCWRRFPQALPGRRDPLPLPSCGPGPPAVLI